MHLHFEECNQCREKLGLGSRQYESVDVLLVEQFARAAVTYISAK